MMIEYYMCLCDFVLNKLHNETNTQVYTMNLITKS